VASPPSFTREGLASAATGATTCGGLSVDGECMLGTQRFFSRESSLGSDAGNMADGIAQLEDQGLVDPVEELERHRIAPVP